MRMIDALTLMNKINDLLQNKATTTKECRLIQDVLRLIVDSDTVDVDKLVHDEIKDRVEQAENNALMMEKKVIERDKAIEELKEQLEDDKHIRIIDVQELWKKVAYHQGRADAYEYAAELFFDREKAEAKKVMRDAAD